MKLHLDFETRSRVDLKKVGLWAYALHPSTQITCFTVVGQHGAHTFRGLERGFDWTWKDSYRLLWPGESMQSIVVAHNAAFEYAMWNLILHRRHGWPARWDPSLWRCTMARAYACGLPGDLDTLGRVLKIKTPKDLDGRKAMLRTCKPLPNGAFDETPEVYETLYKYNATDVQAEMEADELLPELAPSEQLVWEHTLMVNRRGVKIDVNFAAKAAVMSEAVVAGLDKRLQDLTGGAVDKATQIKALTYYLEDAHGVKMPSLDKETVTDVLADPLLPDVAREVLLIRRQVGKKTSVAKYKAALEMLCPDGRVRGLLEYHGAHTGRYVGRDLQPQNFPKGWDKPIEQMQAINDILTLDPAAFVAKYGSSTMDALSDSLRGLFVADTGKTFVCADFNAIEARVLFWLAGALEALAAYRKGESPYLTMAESIYQRKGLSKHGTPQEYDLGKRTILGCGYGMGWRKFRDNAYTETAKKGKPLILSDLLAQRAVRTYRDKYPEVVQLWYEVERAAINAVRDPQGRAFPCAGGKVLWGMTKDRRFLACRLPSGRYLRYFMPTIVEGYRIFCEDPECVHWKEFDEDKCPTRKKVVQLAYQGVNPYTKQWGFIYMYGGSFVENITQAVARDLLVHGMLNAEAKGYPAVLTVHDEDLAEVNTDPTGARDDKDTLNDFIKKMCQLPAWAAGCPVAAEGWVGPRYHK